MAEIRLREAELAGTFRTPETDGPFPGVLALGGSDGGTPEYFLNLLPPEGFACLGLAYWGTTDTSMALAEIPLERIERALRWLIGRDEVVSSDGRVAVVGASKGAELALLTAATFPDLVGPVVAYTPSSVVWVGLDFTLPPGPTRSSWTHRNQPVPYVRFPSDVGPAWSERGMSMLPVCEKGLDDEKAVEEAAIAVERSTGPLLLVSGGDDRAWAAGRMSRMIVERMAKHGRAGDVSHLHYPQAGHMLFPYVRPLDSMIPPAPMDLGGTSAADAEAHASAWGQVVGHLHRAG
jgi:pimeloyl-ACP methyl ester carboxylesterase